jgi:hypothetical protein
MQKRIGIGALFLICLFLSWASTASALVDPIPGEAGFSGFVRPGVGGVDMESNMVAEFAGIDLSADPISSLTASPEGETSANFSFPFQVAYTFKNLKTQAFLGLDVSSLIRFDVAQQLAIKHNFTNIGILQAGFLFSGLSAELWTDPYVTNQSRVTTDRDSHGARFAWGRIFGSDLHFTYTYRKNDIDKENSGVFLGLSASDRQLLDRNGDSHGLELAYKFKFGDHHHLVPAFYFIKDDRDGDARNNDEWNVQLTYAYLSPNPISFTLNGIAGKADYDKANPIPDFNGVTQEDDIYGLSGTIYYKNPWGWTLWGSKPMDFFVEVGWLQRDANIDFYDEQITKYEAGVLFSW